MLFFSVGHLWQVLFAVAGGLQWVLCVYVASVEH